LLFGTSIHTEDVCTRCDTGFAADGARVAVAVESSDIGCFRNVEETHPLCGPCYTDSLTFVFTGE